MDITNLLENQPVEEYVAFLYGPNSMMQSASDWLQESGFTAEQIKYETWW